MLELTDDVFWVRDWRGYGTSDAGSPVRTKGLTANYLPGALRSATRAAPVGGEDAAQAILPRSRPGTA